MNGPLRPDPLSLLSRVALPASVWQAREAAHRAKVAPLANDRLDRSRRGVAHPVWDFLFTYYSFKPGRLMTWVPGVLGDGGATPASGQRDTEPPAVWEVPPMPARIGELARWVATLCAAMNDRAPRFHCYGLHEWAMVYGQSADEIRHAGWRLRLAPAAVAEVVQRQSLVCTHYDAFRFFTPAARPRNQWALTSEGRADSEQGGCLHANMDLYKWAYKLWPWIGSDLVADAFLVAVQGRSLDMRSSPYDLRALGFEPIRIETEEGRDQFRQEQQAIAKAAEPVRLRVLAAARALGRAATVPAGPTGQAR